MPAITAATLRSLLQLARLLMVPCNRVRCVRPCQLSLHTCQWMPATHALLLMASFPNGSSRAGHTAARHCEGRMAGKKRAGMLLFLEGASSAQLRALLCPLSSGQSNSYAASTNTRLLSPILPRAM